MSYERPISADEAIFKAALLQRLYEFPPRFHQIRKRMGLGNRVGFGMLPEEHEVYAAGRLIELRKSRKGGILYGSSGFLSYEYKLLTTIQHEGIVVMPDLSHPAPYIVSIYQRKGWWDQLPYEPRLLDAPDDVIVGLITHELAHFSELGEELTKQDKIRKVFAKWERDLIAHPFDTTTDFFDLQGEGKIDIIAALHGYKPQIIAKLEYMIACLRSYEGPERAGLAVTPAEAIQTCNARLREITHYC